MLSMPSRWSIWDKSKPAGPRPMIATCVRVTGLDPRGGAGRARRFKVAIGDAVGRNAPLIGLPTRNAPRARHNVLGPRDADHLLQARGAARTRDLAETLLGKGIKAGFRDQAEIAGQRQFEADAEAIAAAGSNDRLTAARRRGDVPGEARD